MRRRRRRVSAPGEEALLARLRSLDASVWRLLFDQAYPVLSIYATARLGDARQAGDVIRDAMLRAVEALPWSRRRTGPLRITLLGFVADRIAAIGRLQPVPDPAAVAALPAEGYRFRHAFFALPSCEQDLLALLVAGATLEQAASAIRWGPDAALRAVSTACRLLAPRVPPAQAQALVVEELRAAFPGRPWEPRLEDQQALRAAVVAARNHSRRHRAFGWLALAGGTGMLLLGMLTGNALPRSVRMLAYSAGLPVRSPRVVDVEGDIAVLTGALRRGDAASVDLAARTLTSAFDILDAGEMRGVHPDVEAELLRARQFLNGSRGQTGRPYPAPVTRPLIQGGPAPDPRP